MAKRRERGQEYHPRTRHLTSDGWAQFTNRLFLEQSPYLLQHAHNPVNWYPWGEEAFSTAKKMGRPVLLSVGYSTCHWCHVMEEESFEDLEIAKYLNENYVAIKVDREERPDIDAIYMSAVQAMTGRGGWPMTVWLSPDKKPFYGGTYFPARDGDRGASTGFLTLLKKLNEVYQTQPDRVRESGAKLASALGEILAPPKGDLSLPTANSITRAIDYYQRLLDPVNGGLKGAPKFPSSLPIRLLLRFYRRTGNAEILKPAVLTLQKMAQGGMYDQIGGGFHRYSTDEKWLVPHFEKMLYDNALLAVAYLEAFQITQDENFKRITREILRYVSRDMTSPEGAFYSATDADSPTPKGHREEGYFFTWTPNEIEEVVGKKDAGMVSETYSVTKAGNFEGRNIFSLRKFPLKGRMSALEKLKDKLYGKRQLRARPHRDEKILTAWNALMISAFARAGFVLNEAAYIESAEKAARFILSNLYQKKILYRSFRENHAYNNGYLDDYAFLIAALMDLYEVTHSIQWLQSAVELDQTLESKFEDKAQGGFFMTADDHEKLLVREKPIHDGAEPSGNSVALMNLLRLAEFTTKDQYRVRAERLLKVYSSALSSNPVALAEMLLAVDFYLDQPKEVVLVSPKGMRAVSDPLLDQLRKEFLPNKVFAFVEEGDDLAEQAKVIPLVKSKYPIKGMTTAFVCEKGICKLPTSDPTVFRTQLHKAEKYPDLTK